MLKITGYSDRISIFPGENLQFYVHCEEQSFDAQLVRVRSGDRYKSGRAGT